MHLCVVVIEKNFELLLFQERFRTITQSYYRSANGIIICYDISCRESFINVRRWLEDVSKFAAPNVVKMLIGEKK